MPTHHRVVRVSPAGFAPFRLQLHPPGELVSDTIAETGTWEPFESSLLGWLVQAGDWVLDVGANVGYYSNLAAQRVGVSGRVLAIEPDPDNFALLQANTLHLPIVEAFRLALGSERGRSAISGNPHNRGDLYVTDAGLHSVNVITGDDLGVRGPGLVKIDVQGAEASVLRGLRQTLAAGRTSVIVELWPYGLERFGDSARGLLDELLALGLPAYLIEHQVGRLQPLTTRELCKLALETLSVDCRGFVNLLLTPVDVS